MVVELKIYTTWSVVTHPDDAVSGKKSPESWKNDWGHKEGDAPESTEPKDGCNIGRETKVDTTHTSEDHSGPEEGRRTSGTKARFEEKKEVDPLG